MTTEDRTVANALAVPRAPGKYMTVHIGGGQWAMCHEQAEAVKRRENMLSVQKARSERI